MICIPIKLYWAAVRYVSIWLTVGTDTSPFYLREGGNVINMSITLNGQPPLQVYVKPSREKKIILRSIDLGAMEVVSTFEELRHFNVVGSPFSIPKVALTLAGFHPDFSKDKYGSLEEQLSAFCAGIEVTLLSAIPAGSGLGTSSVLASTVLGAVSEFRGSRWDKQEIGSRTLVLEQLLTTGGGWQDQFGGILSGVKQLQTEQGWNRAPMVHWLPNYLFTDSQYKKCHLLYYTGITRTAKNILAEIVKGMFLNNTQHLDLLRHMKQHTLDMYDAIQRNSYEDMARLVGETWKQNKLLDAGTNSEAVEKIIRQIDDLCLGYKLPGAGGWFFLFVNDGSANIVDPCAIICVIVLLVALVFSRVKLPEVESTYMRPEKVLALCGLGAAVAMAGVIGLSGEQGRYYFFLCFACESIRFPTILALVICETGAAAKQASSYLIMSIVGGAIAPLLMGMIADNVSMKQGFVVPMVCFVVILGYAVGYRKMRKD